MLIRRQRPTTASSNPAYQTYTDDVRDAQDDYTYDQAVADAGVAMGTFNCDVDDDACWTSMYNQYETDMQAATDNHNTSVTSAAKHVLGNRRSRLRDVGFRRADGMGPVRVGHGRCLGHCRTSRYRCVGHVAGLADAAEAVLEHGGDAADAAYQVAATAADTTWTIAEQGASAIRSTAETAASRPSTIRPSAMRLLYGMPLKLRRR
ncbi:MAG: hypothetical protein H6823_08910 [Planctomycetaceae bacterium]|nr:hypothetical protein [Planctomycetaceae bacterium]